MLEKSRVCEAECFFLRLWRLEHSGGDENNVSVIYSVTTWKTERNLTC